LIKELDFSLEQEAQGHANIIDGKVTIYLPTLSSLLVTPEEYFPFNTIEKLLDELIIHEVLHMITGISDDHIIDSWHMLQLLRGRKRDNDNCF